MYCFLNGRYMDVRDARISALDRGFLFGEGLFETWRTYRGRPFAIEEHLRRMNRSARALGIPFDPGEPWHTRTLRLARLNRMSTRSGAVRLTISRGAGPVTLIPERVRRPTRLMLFRPLEPNLGRSRRNGVAVHLHSFGAGVHPALRQIKTVNYLPAVLARAEARKRGCFESLYQLDDGTVLEGTTSNIFVVRRGRLITSPVAAGVLPGVTRSLVLAIAKQVAEVRETRLRESDLLEADEAFLTSSTIEVLPVVRVGRRRLGSGRPGELTRELQKRYRELVARRLDLPVERLGD